MRRELYDVVGRLRSTGASSLFKLFQSGGCRSFCGANMRCWAVARRTEKRHRYSVVVNKLRWVVLNPDVAEFLRIQLLGADDRSGPFRARPLQYAVHTRDFANFVILIHCTK